MALLLPAAANATPRSSSANSHSALQATPTPNIRPRSHWAGGIADAPGLSVEGPGDVRVLLVHHTATGNGYAQDSVPRQIASFHNYHTTSKGWPDVAYNFFVDSFGEIWEGRTGSLAGPVIGDATGGNQGYTQLCCFIGDHTTEPPSAAAHESMISLLAHLADRYGVDPTPGATATFTSRGSNRWPAGSEVTAATISGHRAMSQTTCPGDAAQVLVEAQFPSRVAALISGFSPPAPSEPQRDEPPVAEPPEDTTPETTSSSSSTVADPPERSSTTSEPTVSTSAPSSGDDGQDREAAMATPHGGQAEGSSSSAPAGIWVAAGTAAAAGAVAATNRWRKSRNGPPPDADPRPHDDPDLSGG